MTLHVPRRCAPSLHGGGGMAHRVARRARVPRLWGTRSHAITVRHHRSHVSRQGSPRGDVAGTAAVIALGDADRLSESMRIHIVPRRDAKYRAVPGGIPVIL